MRILEKILGNWTQLLCSSQTEEEHPRHDIFVSSRELAVQQPKLWQATVVKPILPIEPEAKTQDMALVVRKIFAGLHDYSIHQVKRDGNCWIRSLWQVALSHVLDKKHPERLREFIKKIETRQERSGFRIPHGPEEDERRAVIQIVGSLNLMSYENQLIVLNSSGADSMLNRYTRKLIAECMLAETELDPSISFDYITKMLEEDQYGGASEINRFARYFGLKIPEVSQQYSGELQFHLYNASKEEREAFEQNPTTYSTLMFAPSGMHYDFMKL